MKWGKMGNITRIGQDDLKTRLMNRMTAISSQLTHELNYRMKQELELSLAKYEVLLAIDRSENGQVTMSNLSRKLLVSNANMTGMTSRLQIDGFVEKKALASDRRIFSVALTETGKRILQNAEIKHRIWVNELTAPLNAEEIGILNALFDKLDQETTQLAK